MALASHGMAYRRGGAGPTVVLLHGIPGQGQVWEPVEAGLGGAFDVVTPDLIGFGASDGPSRATIAAIFSGALTRLEELYSPVAAALGDLDVPVLVGWGDRDPCFPVEHAERTAAASDGRLRIFDGAGHFLPHERPIDVAEEIAAFATGGNR